MREELLEFLEWAVENVSDVSELIDEHEILVDRYLEDQEC